MTAPCAHPAITPNGKLSEHRCTACGALLSWEQFVAWLEARA